MTEIRKDKAIISLILPSGEKHVYFNCEDVEVEANHIAFTGCRTWEEGAPTMENVVSNLPFIAHLGKEES